MSFRQWPLLHVLCFGIVGCVACADPRSSGTGATGGGSDSAAIDPANLPGDAAASGSLSLSRVTPAEGGIQGGVPLVLEGDGFDSRSEVRFDGVLASAVEVDSAKKLRAMLPAHPTTLGPATITITNPDGAIALRRDLFTYFGRPVGALAFPFPIVEGELVGVGSTLTPTAVDIDKDGHLDWLTLVQDPYGSPSRGLAIQRGDGTGTFTASLVVTFDRGYYDRAYAVTLAEMTGDGILDAIVARNGYAEEVSIHKGLGGGAFEPAPLSTVPGFEPLAVADA